MFEEGWDINEAEWAGKADITRTDFLVAGEASETFFFLTLSWLDREFVIVLDSQSVCAPAVPQCGFCDKTNNRCWHVLNKLLNVDHWGKYGILPQVNFRHILIALGWSLGSGFVVVVVVVFCVFSLVSKSPNLDMFWICVDHFPALCLFSRLYFCHTVLKTVPLVCRGNKSQISYTPGVGSSVRAPPDDILFTKCSSDVLWFIWIQLNVIWS